jgi:hypothetical protein
MREEKEKEKHRKRRGDACTLCAILYYNTCNLHHLVLMYGEQR